MAGRRGSSGPRAKPVEQHLLDGTYMKGRHEKFLPGASPKKSTIPLPPPPKDAEPDLRETWLRLSDTLADRIHTQDDVDAFIVLVEMIVEKERNYKLVAQLGHTRTTAKGDEVIAPHSRIWLDLCGKLLNYFARFSMTPYDRARNAQEGMKSGKADQHKPEDEFGDEAA